MPIKRTPPRRRVQFVLRYARGRWTVTSADHKAHWSAKYRIGSPRKARKTADELEVAEEDAL